MEIGIYIAIAIVVLMFIMGYNKLVRLKEAVYTDQRQIEIQLDERSKVFDSLVNVVKKYMSHEENVLTKIVELRTKSKTLDHNSKEFKETEEELSEIVNSGRLSQGLNVTMEAYPDLKANTNMLQLQESIVSIESKLANAKKAFNLSIEDYNSYAEGVPGVFICKMFSHLKISFTRWNLSAEKIKEHEEKVVQF